MSTQTAPPQPGSSTSTPDTTRIAVISSSVREGRMSPSIADWIVAALGDRAGIEVDLIDLAEVTLPDDGLLHPGGGPRTVLTDRIEAAEAFVVVTPEYNHSYPASLKRLIDWHYSEWELKPAAIVAYGVTGGYAAIEHLRGVLAELSMVTTRGCIGLPSPWESLDAAERYVPSAAVGRHLSGTLSELVWWAGVLTQARDHHPLSV